MRICGIQFSVGAVFIRLGRPTFSGPPTKNFFNDHQATTPTLPPGAPVLRATLEALASTRTPSAAVLPDVRVPDKPLLLDNPAAALPKAGPRRPQRALPRPKRQTRKEAAIALGGLGKMDASAVDALRVAWTATVTDAISRDGAVPATLLPLNVAGAPVSITRAANGRHAGLSGVLVGASRTAWRVATAGGRVVTVARAGTGMLVHGPGVDWTVDG